MQRLEGTAMAELVEGGKLRRADILLAHSKGSYWGWLIRLGTRNYWNHALMLYMVRAPDQGYYEALIIDPKMGSIRVDKITHYFENPHKYDVAIKRLDLDWFQNTEDIRKRSFIETVCDIAMLETTDKVDTRLRRMGRGLLRQIKLVYRFIRRKIRYPRPRKKKLSPIAKRLKISAYGCGGFIQWCYYKGVSHVLKDSREREWHKDVIFHPRLAEPISEYDLLTITPAELAKSDKLTWKYVIKEGEVWEVDNEEDVNLVLKSGEKRKQTTL